MSDPTLGEVPSHWTVTSLGAVCKEGGGSVQTGPFGSQLHARDYVESGIPSIMPLNIGDNRIVEDDIKRITNEDAVRLSKYRVQPGDIVYSRRGDVERHALVRAEQDGWLCGTGCLRVRFGNAEVVPEFASFYLDHPYVRKWIVRHAVGATMPNLNTKIMSAVPFVVPPQSEQKAIANILGTLDDKIELNRRMNETLESIARAIFKSWFVDFDPVRAKLEGQSYEEQSSKSAYPMPAEVFDLFPSTFQDSELGKIPQGWEARPFSDNVQILSGGTPKTKIEEYWNGEIPWYTVKDAPTSSDVWCIDTERAISQAGLDHSAAELFDVGISIISARGTVGKVALVGTPMAMNQSCYGIKGSSDFGDFFTYFNLLNAIGALQQRSHGSVFDTITRDTFSSLISVYPTQETAQKFEEIVSPLLGRVLNNVLEAKTLSQLRDTLLPKLLSGALTVPDALLQAEEML